MPIETQRAQSGVTAYYQCAFCTDFRSSSHSDCVKHEWNAHWRAKARTHYESAWGEEFTFYHFTDREIFDAFAAAYCAVKPKWEGHGWYKEYTYRDTCRGCDMGETFGLKKVDDSECADWIDDGMRERAASLPVLFGLTLDCPPRFERDGIMWRRHSLHIPDESMSINYASPDKSDSPDSNAIVEAWKVWRADRD